MSKKLPAFSTEECLAFERAADPHQWLLTANDLHEQAVALYGRRGRGLTRLRMPGRKSVTWDDTNRSTFLLAAFALENAIKAFLVYEHPDYVADGKLSRQICSHQLVALSQLSNLIPYRTRDEKILATFEAGNESWMRYPCGRNASDLQAQAQMTERLWTSYRRVAAGYGRKLKKLLAKGWTPPHGERGAWESTWTWLA